MTTDQNEPLEYQTLQLVIEPGRPQPHHGEVFHKYVLAAQSPDEALSSLLLYYGEPEVLASPRGIGIIKEASKHDDFAYVYINRENIQVIMSLETHAGLLNRPEFDGNMLTLNRFFDREVAALMNNHISAVGSPPVLSVLAFTLESAGED